MCANCFLLISENIFHLEEKLSVWTGSKTCRQIALVPQAPTFSGAERKKLSRAANGRG